MLNTSTSASAGAREEITALAYRSMRWSNYFAEGDLSRLSPLTGDELAEAFDELRAALRQRDALDWCGNHDAVLVWRLPGGDWHEVIPAVTP